MQHHVLDFFCDNDGSCALTALVNDIRFHIIADAVALQCRLTGTRSNAHGREYSKLLKDVKGACEREAVPESASEDSGVDTKGKDGTDSEADSSVEDAELALHRWMLDPLRSRLQDLAPLDHKREPLTVEGWYCQSTHFFNLEVKDDELCAVELESSQDLESRMSGLIPEISIPKYIREIGVPWFHARDLVVLGGSSTPTPYHPARVRHGEEIFFLKLVDSTQPQPTKREIPILHKLAKVSLYQRTTQRSPHCTMRPLTVHQRGVSEHIRVPKLEGLVAFDDHTKLLGFLQTNIANPAPLTTKLDAEVPQQLRDRWAAEATRVTEVLHNEGIIWGDAKADNFMVDADNRLWIIDFGGSYTEGWVDPEIQETEAGDDMGVKKITNALHDPIANVWDPDSQDPDGIRTSDERAGALHSPKDSKRNRTDSDTDDVTDCKPSKRGRHAETSEKLYCHCERPSSGDMIACDGSDCGKQWFHFDCVGISDVPREDQIWYCEDCEEDCTRGIR